MEITNFTIEILIDGIQLNLLFYPKIDLDRSLPLDREELFAESFLSMQSDTVGTLSGDGRRSCNTWNSIVFTVNSNDILLSSNEFTRVVMEDEITVKSVTLGQFIESKYQELINDL